MRRCSSQTPASISPYLGGTKSSDGFSPTASELPRLAPGGSEEGLPHEGLSKAKICEQSKCVVWALGLGMVCYIAIGN